MSGMLSENWTIPEFAPMEFIPATVKLTIYDNGQVTSPTEALQSFIQDVEAKMVMLSVSQVFNLDQIADAHGYMEINEGAGKIVVVISDHIHDPPPTNVAKLPGLNQ